MYEWIFAILGILALVLMFYYAVIYAPTKKRKENHMKKAIELTKDIGDKKIRCISLTTNRFNGGRAFYLIEIGAETDFDKFCCKLEEGWENSAYSVETARKNVEEIICQMPYSFLTIEDLNISEIDFFKPRNYNKKLKELEINKESDRERINLYFFPDFRDKKLSVIRFNNTINYSKQDIQFYCYVLLVSDNEDKKYIELFEYPYYDEDFANLRIENYIAYYNQNNPWGGSINSTLITENKQMCDFLNSHPLYTHQYSYNSLASIEPYYE